ncbi:hypothetical protein F383_14303 [Gossypium arboreum]|uniref:Uncharacterized protein n=1 Tax=Gossypium arboreum TaxID=29729 RepID=A0A0B0NBA3_GOSAR|nr:hypothetical protein F383_14303 [Gossypium arboreum]
MYRDLVFLLYVILILLNVLAYDGIVFHFVYDHKI